MGFLFPNYNKPGKGVPDFEPKTSRTKLFVKLFARKYTQLVGLNGLYLLFNIPAFVIAYFISFVLFGEVFDRLIAGSIENFNILAYLDQNIVAAILLRIMSAFILMSTAVVTIGPLQAAVTYILRNFGREQHAYIWWDLKDKFKENLKQGLIVMIINMVVITALGYVLNLYLIAMVNTSSMMFYLAVGFVTIFLLMFICMNFYIYPMMVTYDMSIKDLYKNAYYFTFMRLIPNLLMMIGIIAITVAAFAIIPWVGFLLMVLGLPVLIIYAVNFYVDPAFKEFEEE